MTIEEMKDKKKEKGYSYEQMADLSGIPLGTIQKIFSGETKSPRYDTLIALEQLFTEPLEVKETASCYNADRNGSYTLDDYCRMTRGLSLLMDIFILCYRQPLDISLLLVRYTVRLPIT